MKLSKIERKLLKREIQKGFMHAWLAESCAKKDRRRVAAQQPKWNGLSWFALWRHQIEPVQPVPAVKAANASE